MIVFTAMGVLWFWLVCFECGVMLGMASDLGAVMVAMRTLRIKTNDVALMALTAASAGKPGDEVIE